MRIITNTTEGMIDPPGEWIAFVDGPAGEGPTGFGGTEGAALVALGFQLADGDDDAMPAGTPIDAPRDPRPMVSTVGAVRSWLAKYDDDTPIQWDHMRVKEAAQHLRPTDQREVPHFGAGELEALADDLVTREGVDEVTIVLRYRDGGKGDPLWTAKVDGTAGGDEVNGSAGGNTVSDALAAVAHMIGHHLEPTREGPVGVAAAEPTGQSPLAAALDGAEVIQLPMKTPGYGRRLTFERMRATGVLWLINTTVFHPRGWAIGLVYPTDADPAEVAAGNVEPIGWTVYGDGREAWRMSGELTDRCFESWTEFEGMLYEVTGQTELTLTPVDTEEPRP